MARDKNRIISGFTGINSGTITNCFVKMNMKAKAYESGFCGVNSGEIKNSISECTHSAKKNQIGFCKNTKGITNSYFIRTSKLNDDQLLDKSLAGTKEEVISKFIDNKNWEKKDNHLVLQKKNFKETIQEVEATIFIHTEQELIDAAAKVNEGLDEYMYANIELTSDLDLKGKRWIPIGKSELVPFRGVFNGNGHTIRNFIVKEQKSEVSGFFGYIKDAVIQNLQVDCIVHGGKYAGALTGINDNGKILGCQAAVKGDAQYCFGGLVGKNSGQIEHSQCIGQAQNPLNKALFASASSAAVLVAAAAAIVFLYNNGNEGRTRYPAVPVSQEAVPIEGDNDKPVANGNSVEYAMETKLICKKGEDTVNVAFKNPGKSNHDIVVSLQITDEELLKTIGTTGRSKEEQEALEQDETYDEKTNRVTIAESGSVPPGYEMATLKLNTLEDGSSLPKGTYNAIVYLSLYDIKTNAKAMVNSQTPVKLIVKG